MTWLLRKVTATNWDFIESQGTGVDELPADPIGDLKTRHNSLSVWEVQDDLGDLDLAVCALASNYQKPDVLEYALVSRQAIEELGYVVQPVRGTTHHSHANDTMHCDIQGLSAQGLLIVASAMAASMKNGDDASGRKQEAEVIALLATAVMAEEVNLGHLGPSLRSKVEAHISRVRDESPAA